MPLAPKEKVSSLPMNPPPQQKRNSKPLTFKTLLKTEEDIEKCFSPHQEFKITFQESSSKKKPLSKQPKTEFFLLTMSKAKASLQELKLTKDWELFKIPKRKTLLKDLKLFQQWQLNFTSQVADSQNGELFLKQEMDVPANLLSAKTLLDLRNMLLSVNKTVWFPLLSLKFCQMDLILLRILKESLKKC